MTDEQAVTAIKRAIKDEGSHPAYHRQVMARHRTEWPALWAALDALLATSANGPEEPCRYCGRSTNTHNGPYCMKPPANGPSEPPHGTEADRG